MNIDLHVHTCERSACSRAGMAEMIDAAIRAGLDGIAVTDHEALVPPAELAELNRHHAPFRIFRGIERHIPEDVVVLGLADQELETIDDYTRLVEFARSRGGYVILPHPFRYADTVGLPVDRLPPDAVEIHSMNTGGDDEPLIASFIREIGSTPIVASDAHDAVNVGVFHIELARQVETDEELVAELKRRTFTLRSRPQRIAELNEEIDRREAEIRTMIRQGFDRDEYRRTTGQWEGLYDRVARGKSYRL
jgi:hypothetical protein